ncbi:MAG: formyl-CoA transferase [Desulfobacca sp. RBG_16_60_12]|nr:MAG: formyl-CoA transferase [Desulfobacca sp. RBG_16_60_12]
MERNQSNSQSQTGLAQASKGPLAGILVIELGQLMAGPFAGHLLADFGAEVIKVEAPGTGDASREWGHHRYRGRGLWWPVLARNKKCITLDLRSARGQMLLKRLVAKADALIENFRPGTLEGWGLGPEELLAVNPRLVMTRVSGYGQTGPYAKRAGFASVGEAMGGLRYINGYPGEKPPRMGISLGDSLAAIYATLGTLMALYWRDALGGSRGQIVDASIMESCFALLESMVPEYDKVGAVREPAGSSLPNVAPSNLYRSRDGKWMVIAGNIDSVFRRLCQAIDQPDLANDPRYATHKARGEHAAELDELIATWAGQRNADEIDRLLNEFGVVCGPIYTIADIFRDPHYAAREMIVRMKDSEIGDLAMPGLVPKLSETPGRLDWTGPIQLGSHNLEVYGELLGLTQAELAELAAEGII